MAADLPLPEHVFVHGFLLGADQRKMSKSLGNVLDPFEVMDRFGTDALRFYLLRAVGFGADGPVSMESVEQRYDGELANELGNLASRTTAMVARYRDGSVPAAAPELAAELEDLAADVAARIDAADLTGALDAIWARVRRLNRYVEEQAPWSLAKDPAQADRLDVVLATLVEGLRIVAVLLHPWMPASAAKLLAALGTDDVSYAAASLGAGRVTRVDRLEPLFPKHAEPSGGAAASSGEAA